MGTAGEVPSVQVPTKQSRQVTGLNKQDAGLFRVGAVCPEVAIADPAVNAAHTIAALQTPDLSACDLVVFPELGLTGYTCADLFAQQTLLDAAEAAVVEVAAATRQAASIVVVGLPLRVQTSLMNVAVVLSQGRLVAAVPKQFLPSYQEFYEGRWFRAADDTEPAEVVIGGQPVPFGLDVLVRRGSAIIGVEICEDLWTPLPPSSFQAIAGANVLVNLSASNETIGKATWRRDLVKSQSGRCLAGYVYSSAGPSESTTDLVFGGHCMIAENGQLLRESPRVGDGGRPWSGTSSIVADLDLQRLAHDRRVISSFDDGRRLLRRPFRILELAEPVTQTALPNQLLRPVDAHPFVPDDTAEREHRCAEILGIQTAALAKRVGRLPVEAPLVIGISGGLDSTLALLVAVEACDRYGWPRHRIRGLTMPGFGTTERTERQAAALMEHLEISSERIDIRPLCLQTFRSLAHRPLGLEVLPETTVASLQEQLGRLPDDATDLVFENVQARLRTFLLMSRGFVLGTGDLSEQALGWSTYNGDHMSMYNVNSSIPKTLVRFLVRYAAEHDFASPLTELLHAIAETPITPELLPTDARGEIRQQTEQTIGAYELHDFFLYHVVRNGFSAEKIRYLASQARFDKPYSADEIAMTLDRFYQRFFANQFKRSCVPDGPKVGSVSLSPRGDWRMPSDADDGGFRSD